MGTANNISFSITIAADFGPMGKGVAMGNCVGGLNVLIPSIRGNLFFEHRE